MNAAPPLAAPPLAGAFAKDMPGISPDVYGEADFRAVAQIVREEAGIMLPPGKAMLVYSRLAPLVRASGKGTFKAFIEMIRERPEERRKAVCALTTNHTFFYREQHHFEHFAHTVRPWLLDELGHGEAVRMWSAGCSSGEEVFSLTMSLLGPDRPAGKALASRDVRILASDIADHALAKASAATYAEQDIAALPAPLREAWTTSTAGQVTIGPEARGLVQFKRLNLHGEWPMRRPFQVIFCRNVMIYFDQPTKDRLVERFAHQLVPGGFLYIGHSERVSGAAESMLDTVGPTIYRRRMR
ncbi:MAG TPA: CheR family methyltransferase [Novosphingobium sp.]|nr:CheR family methyltransferase [Novosphingobium sp.]HZV08773.1 CheR family methyltransferase [Novosphingobium sp.]